MEKLDNLEVSDELWRSAAAVRTNFQQKTLFLFRHGSPRTALNLGIAVLQNGNEEMTTHLERTYRQIDAPGGYALRPKPYATVVTAHSWRD